MVEEKEYQVKTNTYLFQNRLLVKCMGKKEWIEKFCSYIARVFPPEKIVFSPILEDRGSHGYEYFCFINVLMSLDAKRKADLNSSGGTE